VTTGVPGFDVAAIIDSSTTPPMKRFFIFIIPVLACAAIVHEHAMRCQTAATPAGQLPICE
jgi:hypothetical protein